MPPWHQPGHLGRVRGLGGTEVPSNADATPTQRRRLDANASSSTHSTCPFHRATHHGLARHTSWTSLGPFLACFLGATILLRPLSSAISLTCVLSSFVTAVASTLAFLAAHRRLPSLHPPAPPPSHLYSSPHVSSPQVLARTAPAVSTGLRFPSQSSADTKKQKNI